MREKSIIINQSDNHDKILSLLKEPQLIGMIGDADAGKSNVLYFMIKALRQEFDFKLYTYGLRVFLQGEQKIYSVEELEVIQKSIIIIDEFASLFDVDDRKEKKQIERTLRLIFHNNNVVLFSGLPENYKKFIASKLNSVIFKRCAKSDFINGSRVKKIAYNFEGIEQGSAVLDIKKDKALVYDGKHYHMVNIPYLPETDTKASNEDILQKRTN